MFLRLFVKIPALALVVVVVFAVNAPRDATSAESGAATRSVPVDAGDLAPDFTLSDQDGRPHTLSKALATRDAVVLIFYRGHW